MKLPHPPGCRAVPMPAGCPKFHITAAFRAHAAYQILARQAGGKPLLVKRLVRPDIRRHSRQFFPACLFGKASCARLPVFHTPALISERSPPPNRAAEPHRLFRFPFLPPAALSPPHPDSRNHFSRALLPSGSFHLLFRYCPLLRSPPAAFTLALWDSAGTPPAASSFSIWE